MKRTMTIFATMFVASVILISCNNYGKEKNFNDLQLFYTSAVTEAEANSLGKYLDESGFADSGKKTVQLNKSGKTYEFRMVVKPGIEKNEEYVNLGKLMAAELSYSVFNNKPVEVHFCDETLKTLRVINSR
jgi:hypothetical protein